MTRNPSSGCAVALGPALAAVLVLSALAIPTSGCSSGETPHDAGDAGANCDALPAACGRCATDRDCRPGAPRCDPRTSRCVACLPQYDDCGAGRCVQVNARYQCSATCLSGADCTGSDAGTTAAECCGGLCVDPSRDLENCGGCDHSCPELPNAAAACIDGACGVGPCSDGYGDCDADPTNGCEALLASDGNNCGACGNACRLSHANAICASGRCGVSSCSAGWGDCDGSAENGCESRVYDDVNNCGACGTICPVYLPFCRSGVCAAN